MFKDLPKWMHDTATVLFDDTKNDLRALPKTVRLQILIVLSALWSTAFSVWVFTVPMFVYGWLGMFLGHLLVIFVAYYTFKQFQDNRTKKGRKAASQTVNKSLVLGQQQSYSKVFKHLEGN